jgi:hypothetical protein
MQCGAWGLVLRRGRFFYLIYESCLENLAQEAILFFFNVGYTDGLQPARSVLATRCGIAAADLQPIDPGGRVFAASSHNVARILVIVSLPRLIVAIDVAAEG